MNNVLLLLKAVFVAPFVIAGGMLLLVLSYLVYPIVIVGSIFLILKANEQTSDEEDEEYNDERYWKPERHKS